MRLKYDDQKTEHDERARDRDVDERVECLLVKSFGLKLSFFPHSLDKGAVTRDRVNDRDLDILGRLDRNAADEDPSSGAVDDGTGKERKERHADRGKIHKQRDRPFIKGLKGQERDDQRGDKSEDQKSALVVEYYQLILHIQDRHKIANIIHQHVKH